ANRTFADAHGGVLLLRIDDTDAARNVDAAALLRDLDWLGLRFDEGPYRQSERCDLYRAAAERLLSTGSAEPDAEGGVRFGRATLLRPDGSATYQLASLVDDADLGITHVIRGRDHVANEALQTELARSLGSEAPEYIHHGLVLGE